MDKMQEEFEKWASGKGLILRKATSGKQFYYLFEDTDYAWEAWQAARTLPEGFVMVPVEPTKAMIDAGRWHEYRDEGDCAVSYVEDAVVASVWSYMLSAAPEVNK